MKILFSFLAILFVFACQPDAPSASAAELPAVNLNTLEIAQPELSPKEYPEFDRSTSIQKVKDKIAAGEPLIIHAYVPLCDNENQGIVPVPGKLGNGMDLRNNLYWGAMYGLRNYFPNISNWKIKKSIKGIDDNVLERVIFYKEFSNGAKAYLVADAYAGDQMKACLNDFLSATAGKLQQQVQLADISLDIASAADLLLFNGHNGLMDYQLDFIDSIDDQVRDVSVIGCISHSYFADYLKHAKGYPLLMTTNLMAPEAYVMESVINSWVEEKKEEDFPRAAGIAYNKFQNCGIRGATKLFRSGW